MVSIYPHKRVCVRCFLFQLKAEKKHHFGIWWKNASKDNRATKVETLFWKTINLPTFFSVKSGRVEEERRGGAGRRRKGCRRGREEKAKKTRVNWTTTNSETTTSPGQQVALDSTLVFDCEFVVSVSTLAMISIRSFWQMDGERPQREREREREERNASFLPMFVQQNIHTPVCTHRTARLIMINKITI